MPFIEHNKVDKVIMNYFMWLGWINSAINPFIYAFYSPDFRIAFWRLTINHFKKGVHERTEKFAEAQQKRPEVG